MRRWILVFLAAAGIAGAVTAAEPVAREQRRLLIVDNLATHAAPDWRWMYRLMESGTVLLAHRTLGGSYRDIHLLSGAQATEAGLRHALQALATPDTQAIDVLVQLHGSPGAVYFEEGGVPTARLGHDLSGQKGLHGKLRALYSGACYGATHAADWLAGGFAVANGARLVNTNGLYDLPAFLASWRAGKTFQAAQDRGNHPGWIRFFDRWADRLGFAPGGADSFKIVAGRGETTLNGAAAEIDGEVSVPAFAVGASIDKLPPADSDGLVRIDDAAVSRLAIDDETSRDWQRLQKMLRK